jgi:hypothetical protein
LAKKPRRAGGGNGGEAGGELRQHVTHRVRRRDGMVLKYTWLGFEMQL